MSFDYYTNWWITAKGQLQQLMQKDEFFRQTFKPQKRRDLANHLIGGLYARYAMLVQDLDTCLDQLCQVQKRVTMKKLVDSAVQRLYELTQELRNIDLSEFHYIDGNLVELKLIPHDVEILHPALFCHRPLEIEEMWRKIQSGERLFARRQAPRSRSASRMNLNPSVSRILEAIQSRRDMEAQQSRSRTGSRLDIAQKMEEAGAEQKEAEEEQIAAEEEQVKKDKKKRPKPQKFVPEDKQLTDEEREAIERKEKITDAVTLIQNHERSRQGRLYWSDNAVRFKERRMLMLGQKPPEPPPLKIANAAALKIQTAWRGHSVRQLMKYRERKRRLLIGMTEESWKSTKEFEKLEQNLEKRRGYFEQRMREYIQANLAEKVRLLRVMAPGLMEDIGDEIREWFYQWYKRAKNFDKYPPEEKGGSILVVRGQTLTPEQWLEEVEKKRRFKVKTGGKDLAKEKAKKEKEKKEAEKKKKEAEKKKKEAERKRKMRAKPQDFEFELEETKVPPGYKDAIKEYRKLWAKRDPFDNPDESHYMDLIHEQKCYEVQLEVRAKVDELMRIELELLEEALEKDRKKRGGKGKRKKGKNKKKKKKKGKKGKKDMTSKRTTEDLFQELVDNGIIRTYQKTNMSEYRGDFSYNNFDLRNNNFNPPQTLGDVRQAVVMNCILPMGVDAMKKPKSVLIAGPRLSGKHLLANAIFTETKCVLFDLSPEITAGKYEGTQGMKMLIHLITKMSKLLQPSIIFFDGAEKIFYKKVPKEERDLDPKRIGKKLLKGIIKPLKPDDKILVLGITNKPWAATASKMKKAFERVILIPKPDYGAIYQWWRELLMAYHGVDREFDVTSLTKLTVNYPLCIIKDVVERMMTPRRIVELKYKPLTPGEVFEYFFYTAGPITDKEYKKFTKWYNKIPLGRLRLKLDKFYDKQREIEAKQAEKLAQKQSKK